jgi:hypothetical protein
MPHFYTGNGLCDASNMQPSQLHWHVWFILHVCVYAILYYHHSQIYLRTVRTRKHQTVFYFPCFFHNSAKFQLQIRCDTVRFTAVHIRKLKCTCLFAYLRYFVTINVALQSTKYDLMLKITFVHIQTRRSFDCIVFSIENYIVTYFPEIWRITQLNRFCLI